MNMNGDVMRDNDSVNNGGKMYIPAHSIRIRDNRIVFHTDIMEIIDAFCYYGQNDNGIDECNHHDVFNYRFMYEYRDHDRFMSGDVSFSRALFEDERWNAMIKALNMRLCNLGASVVYVNERKHIALNNVIVTMFVEDEIALDYQSTIDDYISYFKDTDVEEIGGRIYDVDSLVNTINAFTRYVRTLNE